MFTDYLILALLWTVYCIIHSALIAVPVTAFMRRAMGSAFRGYRLFFNLISIGLLVPLVSITNSERWHSAPVFVWDGYLRPVRWVFIALAVYLAIAGARHYSLLQFLGVRQLFAAGNGGAMTATGEFDSSGILSLVRHPWYTATFLFLWARDFNLATLTVNVVLSVYLVVGTILEERKLMLEFGSVYRTYQECVSMFVPLKWLLRPQDRNKKNTSPQAEPRIGTKEVKQ